MKLILVRHGETEANVNGTLEGRTPGELTEKGLFQARRLGERLREEKIDIIYCSDLKRAMDTAHEIKKFHPDVPIVFVKELRERDLGPFEGKTKEEIGMDKDVSAAFVAMEGAETSEAMFGRANAFLSRVLAKHVNDSVLFVAHNGILKAIIAAIEKRAMDDIIKLNFLDNCSVTVYEIKSDGKAALQLMNCTKHLE